MHIQNNRNLKECNTLGIDVSARHVADVTSVADLEEALLFAKEKKLDTLVLGGGSNICFSEKEIQKLVLHIRILGIALQEDVVVVGAGEVWDSFVQEAIEIGLPYIENLSGIPGTVGASPIQNIGAYGVEVKDIIEWVEVFNKQTQKVERLANIACQFAYRDSIFKKPQGEKYIVTRVAFKAEQSSSVNISYKDLQEFFIDKKPTKQEIREAVLSIRSGKFPDLKKFGTAGSFFKNPIISKEKYKELSTIYSMMPSYPVDEGRVKIPLAWILDSICNLKGYREGNVWLHNAQPLILVTNKKATAGEIYNFSETIKKIVFEKISIRIENEVVFKK